MGHPLFIIASISWVEPVQLIPQVFNVFAIDTLVPFLFMAVTSSIITSMLLHFNDKYQVSRRAQQSVMTFCMWIKSHIITENASCKQRRRLTKSRYCPKYYIRSTKHRPARIATKNKRTIIGPILRAYTSTMTSTSIQRKGPINKPFDSDSFIIHIDNGASATMSNKRDHFETLHPLKPNESNHIAGVNGGVIPVKGRGTVKWKLEDDDGVIHEIKIKNALYVPEMQTCLLCPQHWSQNSNDHFPKRNGTWCASYADECVLYWNQCRHKRSIKWDNKTNTAVLRSAPGAYKYRVFAATLEASQDIETNEHLCYRANIQDTHVISDDEEELSNQHEQSQDMFRHEPAPNDKASDIYAAAEKHNKMREENLTNFMDNLTEKPVHVIGDTDERLLSANNPQAELLRWHYRLGHISFARLRILALLGTIPRKLIHAKTPKCAGCMYGAMTKRPWRTKAQQNKSKIKSVTRPGDCVSIDQLESPTPGFVAQLKGALTKKRYRAATVFVDHAS